MLPVAKLGSGELEKSLLFQLVLAQDDREVTERFGHPRSRKQKHGLLTEAVLAVDVVKKTGSRKVGGTHGRQTLRAHDYAGSPVATSHRPT